MCGIIGYVGEQNAADILINGLKQLEYRGYDSAGMALCTEQGIKLIRSVGKVEELEQHLPTGLTASCGIGHTRWATHGGVSEINCHPHRFGRVTLIHNGIIENYLELREELAKTGRRPVSQTDTEIACMLLDSLYQGDAYAAIREAVNRLQGSYAFCIIFDDQPKAIYCIRKGSPLVACSTEMGTIVASDIVALLRYSKEYFVLEKHWIVKLAENSITVTDLNGEEVLPELVSVNWDMTAAQKNGYKHFMQKEIFEQPDALRRNIYPRTAKYITGGPEEEMRAFMGTDVPESRELLLPDLTADCVPDSMFRGVNHIVIAACGTAYHAGMVGKVVMEQLLRIPVEVDLASEFRYRNPIIDANTLVVTISQSGETADTLAAARLAKKLGARTLAIANVKGSSLARICDYVLYTYAGPEIAVASTKAYTAQLAVLYLMSLRFAYAISKVTSEQCSEYMKGLRQAVTAVETMLTKKDLMKDVSSALVKAEDLFFIGRGIDYGLACEGSIKLKEISYIHSEAYAAGELKHGTLSLITEGIPVIALATQRDVLPKMVSNMKEVRARGALMIVVSYPNAGIEQELYDYLIEIPEVYDMFSPLPAAICLQMIAYYTSSYRGLDVDQPRNLAKSVTVE